MTPINLKIDRSLLTDSLLGTVNLFASDPSLSRVSVAATYWRHRTNSGQPDYRYKPATQIWSLDLFCDEMEAISRFGHFREWEENTKTVLSDKLSRISAFASFGGPTSARANCEVRTGGLYWTNWRHAPIYWSHQFDAFNKAVACLTGLRKALDDDK